MAHDPTLMHQSAPTRTTMRDAVRCATSDDWCLRTECAPTGTHWHQSDTSGDISVTCRKPPNTGGSHEMDGLYGADRRRFVYGVPYRLHGRRIPLLHHPRRCAIGDIRARGY